jgi:hypothetical protein
LSPLSNLQGEGELENEYVEGSNYMDVVPTATVKQNRLIEMRGALVPSNPVKNRLSSLL